MQVAWSLHFSPRLNCFPANPAGIFFAISAGVCYTILTAQFVPKYITRCHNTVSELTKVVKQIIDAHWRLEKAEKLWFKN